DVGLERHAAHLFGHRRGAVAVHVDAGDPGSYRGEGVRGLATDAVATTRDDERLPVEPQQVGVVGDREVVGGGHRVLLLGPVVAGSLLTGGSAIRRAAMARGVRSQPREGPGWRGGATADGPPISARPRGD